MVIPLKDLNPARRRPVVTLLLIAANILVFIAIQPRGGDTPKAIEEENRFLYAHAAVPCEITTDEPLSLAEIQTGVCGSDAGVGPVIGNPEPFFAGKNVYLAIFTSMFLHASWLHLGFNMLFLWVFGNNVEDRLGHIGFLLFYAVTGVVATLTQVAFDTGSTAPVIGASGAIAGVMGAYLVFWPRARIFGLLFIFPIALPANFVLIYWFLTQFLTDTDSGVAWGAHVGGFVAGAIIAFLLGRLFGWSSPQHDDPHPRSPADYDDVPPAPPPFGRGGGPDDSTVTPQRLG